VSKMEELRWVRIFTPLHIPTYLVEQIKKRDYTVEDFYKYHGSTCVVKQDGKDCLNPFSHLYVLVNPDHLTKGFLWFCIDPLSKSLVIQTYSVDKEYWKDGGAVDKLVDHIKDIHKKANLNKIFWITAYPKHSKKHGFHPSKDTLMEYKEDK
jgi:hypothetical protein